MAQVPTIGRIVHYHHPGEGVVGGEPRDFPAMILEVSGGPISPPSQAGEVSQEGDDTGLQTKGGPAAIEDPYVCMLEVFRPRGTEWRRSSEGVEPGQWSWPAYQQGASTTDLLKMIEALRNDFEAHLGEDHAESVEDNT